MAKSGATGVIQRRGKVTRRQKTIARVITFVVFAFAWQVFAERSGGLLIPTFTETMFALAELLTSLELWLELGVSNQALAIGFAVSVVFGVPIGLMMGRFETLQKIADPYVSIMLTTPMAAVIPLLVMSVGLGLLSRVSLVVLFSLPMVIVNTQTGVRQVDSNLIEMARSFGASEREIWRRIFLPGAMPSIMAGIRIGLGRAITGMVVVELLMVSAGVGGLILNYRASFRSGHLYGVVIVVVFEALVLISLARRLEQKLTPWAAHDGVTS